MEFTSIGNLRMNTGDILILNLVTRKKFWMWKLILTTQIKEKAADRLDSVDFGRRNEYDWSPQSIQMIVENDRIVINYKIKRGGRNPWMIFAWYILG